jgi:hypothetical protein
MASCTSELVSRLLLFVLMSSSFFCLAGEKKTARAGDRHEGPLSLTCFGRTQLLAQFGLQL